MSRFRDRQNYAICCIYSIAFTVLYIVWHSQQQQQQQLFATAFARRRLYCINFVNLL